MLYCKQGVIAIFSYIGQEQFGQDKFQLTTDTFDSMISFHTNAY